MKKALIFVLILTVISSIFVVSAFAESSDVSTDTSIELSSADDNDSVESSEASVESTESEESTESDESDESSESVDNATNDTSDEGAVSFDFTVERIPVALKHMAVGMIGVLIVLSLIATVVFILNKVFKTK